MGIIEVDMFSEDVNTLDHPKVIELKKVLEEVADEYDVIFYLLISIMVQFHSLLTVMN